MRWSNVSKLMKAFAFFEKINMNTKTLFFIFTALLIIQFSACTSADSPNEDQDTGATLTVNIPEFNPDNAYNYIQKQVAFGPRVPNTPAHDSCAQWMADQFRSFGARVIVQEDQVKAYTGEMLNMKNIIASYNPDRNRRVLLCAHWDSRHIADSRLATERTKEPILGADDGGSGVGVLLEVARCLKESPLKYMGVDIVLFDVEDYGQPSDGGGYPEQLDTWCLGSQYWSKNFHVAGYKADYGILLDMVGSKGARFTKEGSSMEYAPNIVNKVWKEAINSGYSGYFYNDQTQKIIDDHVYVNRLAKIPTIDIINRPSSTESGFGAYWHTHNDNMEVIDKNTLKAVGQTVINVIYKESIGEL